jgi:preprotein translocase subunit YajC
MTKMSSVLSQFIAQTSPAPQQGGMGSVMIIGYVLLFAAMYFFMIAPQRKKQKEHEKLLASLQSGDDVLTTGGIYGTITNVKDDRFVLRIGDNTKVEVGKGFVTQVFRKQDGDKK